MQSLHRSVTAYLPPNILYLAATRGIMRLHYSGTTHFFYVRDKKLNYDGKSVGPVLSVLNGCGPIVQEHHNVRFRIVSVPLI